MRRPTFALLVALLRILVVVAVWGLDGLGLLQLIRLWH
jgi:hypothetical protein